MVCPKHCCSAAFYEVVTPRVLLWFAKFPNKGLVHGREYTEDELWEHYTYFIKKLAPVAEAAGVYVGIHPDDPYAQCSAYSCKP